MVYLTNKHRIIGNILILFIIFLSSVCSGKSLIKIKHKSLLKILEKYTKKGFDIIGPAQIVKVSSNNIIVYNIGSFSKDNKTIIINEKGKPTKLYDNDWIYILKRNKHIIFIKIHKEDNKNE